MSIFRKNSEETMMKDFLETVLLCALGIFFIACFITIFAMLILGADMYYEWLKEFIT